MSERAAEIDAILREHFPPATMTFRGNAVTRPMGGKCRCGMECYDLAWHYATVLDDALAAPCSEPEPIHWIASYAVDTDEWSPLP